MLVTVGSLTKFNAFFHWLTGSSAVTGAHAVALNLIVLSVMFSGSESSVVNMSIVMISSPAVPSSFLTESLGKLRGNFPCSTLKDVICIFHWKVWPWFVRVDINSSSLTLAYGPRNFNGIFCSLGGKSFSSSCGNQSSIEPLTLPAINASYTSLLELNLIASPNRFKLRSNWFAFWALPFSFLHSVWWSSWQNSFGGPSTLETSGISTSILCTSMSRYRLRGEVKWV